MSQDIIQIILADDDQDDRDFFSDAFDELKIKTKVLGSTRSNLAY